MEEKWDQKSDWERLKRLDNPDREALLPHAPVLEALNLEAGMQVADIGAGLGYFTFPLAIAVRREGRVLAVDPNPLAREELKRRVEEAMIHNIFVQEGSAGGVAAADHTLDRALWHALLHDVPHMAKAGREMHRVLKRHGLWVIVDWRLESSEWSRFTAQGWDRATVERLVVDSGQFRVKDLFEPGPAAWGIVFERQ